MFKKLKWLLISILFLGAGYVIATDQRFADLIDPTVPLQLSLEGIDSELLGSRVSEVVQKMTGTFKVSSVLIRGDQSVAFLNNQRVSVGSQIDGVTVVKIDRDGVVLRRGIEEFRVNLHEGSAEGKAANDS